MVMRYVLKADHLDVSGSRVFKHINSLFDRFSFGSYIEFRAIDNITAFFGGCEFGRDFNRSHGKTSYEDKIAFWLRKSRGSMDSCLRRNEKKVAVPFTVANLLVQV
ncbi:MAG: hypothetical protein HW382_96 [Deltaproteobacteria bacterium]|nr:hypothetical protein [Deltaproteobacteria bacterium]MBM2838790.1 hypothetical protein [Deltaproteobacteria bacterium]